jgi:hypothetical protein
VRIKLIIILIDLIDISFFMDKPTHPTDTRPPHTMRAPSPRLIAALAAAMLCVGVAVGAAIGPAPTASVAAGPRSPLLLQSLLAAAGVGHKSVVAVQPPATDAAPTPRARRKRARSAAATTQPAASTNASEEATPSSTTPTGKGKSSPVKLPPVTNVWLIELSGSTLATALEAPTGAPYINGQAAPTGTTLSGWSAIEASAFADDASLMATSGPRVVDTIVQPPCPEGAAGAQCATGTPGALTAADEFLKATLPTITSSPTYRSSGLIVVTFGSIAAGAASGLPAGSESATLTSQPPAGALLISPFVTAGASASTPFTPASPTQSLEKLLHS